VLFSTLGMRGWLDRAAPELTALGSLLVVGRANVGLYEYLSRRFADDGRLRVVLDRRRAAPGAPSTTERRRRSVDDKLRDRGVAIVGES